jgi:hypothetical protein
MQSIIAFIDTTVTQTHMGNSRVYFLYSTYQLDRYIVERAILVIRSP